MIRSNGLELAYEEMGTGEPLLLVMGIGAQLVLWPDAFCERLADRGFRVIRFDNRDVGLSTKLSHAGVPDIRLTLARGLMGLPIPAPYTLLDMADDCAGLLDALDIDAAHVAGASLGGMISQAFAIAHPQRVRSLTSIMSSPGGRRHMLSHPAAVRALLAPAPRSAREAEEWNVRLFRTVGSRGYPLDEDEIRSMAARSFERCADMRGFARQFAAILATGDRRGALRFVRVPSVVLHGTDDRLILPAAGQATARAIPGARLRVIHGMGHDLPRGAWPILIDEIVGVARRAGEKRHAASRPPGAAYRPSTRPRAAMA